MNEKITYKNLIKSDIEELTPIMKASFDADTRMHTDLEENGPSGYDNGKLLCFLMNLEDSESKVIYYNDEMIGEYTIIRKNDIYTLDMLFISPDYESKGLGTRVLNDIEKSYEGVKTWIVETPSYSKRNHYFYEKAGFRRIREKIYDDESKSLIFSKHKKKYKPEIKKYQEKRDYEKIIDSCKNEGWEAFYKNKKSIYKKALINSETLVLYENDQYCGYFRFITDGIFTIYGCEMIIDDEYKRKGYGTLLLNEAMNKYPTCCIDVLSDNDIFYEKNQFLKLCTGMRKLSTNNENFSL